MKITFLGSSHGVPEPNRKCSCILVTVGKNHYLADVGCDPTSPLIDRNIKINSVKGVFVTHPHGDHCNGLIPFADLINWYFTDANPAMLLPVDVKDLLVQWITLMTNGKAPRPLDIRTYEAGVIFDDGSLKVTAIPTKHCPHSHSLLLEAEGKRVLYAGDLKSTAEDFPHKTAADGLDFLIAESAHFSTLKYAEILKDLPIKEVAITHHFAPNEQFLETKKALEPLPMTLVYDGMEFNI